MGILSNKRRPVKCGGMPEGMMIVPDGADGLPLVKADPNGHFEVVWVGDKLPNGNRLVLVQDMSITGLHNMTSTCPTCGQPMPENRGE